MMFNKLKSMLAVLVVCIMLMQSITFAADSNDIRQIDNIREAKILLALDIMDGFTEETYHSDSTVTRAEFTVYIAKLLGLYDNSKDSKSIVPYTDVKSDHWAAQSIALISSLGIVKGFSNGTFRPEETVTYEQAVKFIVYTLGYHVYAEQKGGYPYGYLSVASEKGVLKNVTVQGGLAIKLGDAVNMIYNALSIEMLTQTEFSEENQTYTTDKGKTLLSENLNVYKKVGKLTATSVTKLTGASDLNNGEVAIDGIVYKTEKNEIEDLLGYKITFYYKDDVDLNEKTILYAEVSSNSKSIVIKSEDINSYQNRVYSYVDHNDVNKTVEISNVADIIYNGKAKLDYTDSTFVPSYGWVTLIDSQGTGKYDLVKISKYDNCVVQSINEAENTVYDKYSAVNKLVLDPKDTSIKFRLRNKSGILIKITELVAGDVLSYTKSEDSNSKYFDIIVCKDTVEGIVEEVQKGASIQKDRVKIKGTEYGIAEEFYHNYGDPKMNDEGIFHLDIEGRIASLDKTGLDYINYAYLTKAQIPEKKIDKNIEFKLFDSDGEFVYFNGADSVQIDGETGIKGIDILKKLGYTEPNPVIKPQVISYELNSKGEICKIDTTTPGSKESEDSLRLQYDGSSKLKYKGSTLTFAARFCMTTSTIIINLPTDLTDDSGYSILSAKDFTNDTEYTVRAYSSKLDTPTVNVVITENAGSKAIDGDSPITIVENVTQVLNSDDEMVYKLYGNSEGKEIEAITSLETASKISGLKAGDAIRYGVDTKKEISDVKLVYSAQDESYKLSDNPSSTDFIAYPRFLYGGVYSKSNGYIRVATNIANIANSKDNDLETYQADKFKIVLCEVSNGKVKIRSGTVDDIVEYKRSGNDCSKVLIQTRYGDPKAIYIFKKV